MQEPEKCGSELLVVARTPALADPTCEEGGGAKLREAVGANAEITTACESDPADFCTTEKKEGAEEGEVLVRFRIPGPTLTYLK